MAGSIWTRTPPAAAPHREALSREQIVTGALTMLDADGLTGLSMRRLAAHLEAGTTSLYWHVATKDDLLELVVDRVYGEVRVPDPATAGWRPGVSSFAESLRAVLRRHPWLTGVAFAVPGIGPQAMGVAARALTLFEAAGFTGRDIDFAMGAVMSYTLGVATSEATWHITVEQSGRTPQEWVADVVAAAEPAATEHPQVAAAIGRHEPDVDAANDQAFTFGLESLLDGLQARLERGVR